MLNGHVCPLEADVIITITGSYTAKYSFQHPVPYCFMQTFRVQAYQTHKVFCSLHNRGLDLEFRERDQLP